MKDNCKKALHVLVLNLHCVSSLLVHVFLQDMKDHCKKALANVGAADDVCDVSDHVTSGAMAESVWREQCH